VVRVVEEPAEAAEVVLDDAVAHARPAHVAVGAARAGDRTRTMLPGEREVQPLREGVEVRGMGQQELVLAQLIALIVERQRRVVTGSRAIVGARVGEAERNVALGPYADVHRLQEVLLPAVIAAYADERGAEAVLQGEGDLVRAGRGRSAAGVVKAGPLLRSREPISEGEAWRSPSESAQRRNSVDSRSDRLPRRGSW
jgi:hypothetical protein